MKIKDARNAAMLIDKSKIVVGTTLIDTTGFYEVTHIRKDTTHSEISVYAVEFYIDDYGNITYPTGSEHWLTHFDLTGMEILI